MAAGIGLGQLLGVVREARAADRARAFLAVQGPGAPQLAERLSRGGDPAAVRVGSGSAGALATVVLLADAPSGSETEAMRRAARASAAIVVVRTGGHDVRLPYVFPDAVIEADGGDVDVARLARALAAELGAEAAALAARLPVLQDAVERDVVARTAVTNAAVAVLPWIRQAHMPLMTLAQARMLLALDIARGRSLPDAPRELAAVAGPELAAALAAGVGLRGFYRRLPVRGRLLGAAVAYGGTRALGELRRRL